MEDVLQRIEQKIDAMGGRFDMVDERLDQVDRRLDQVDGRLSAVEGGQASLTMMVEQQGVLQEALRDDIKQTLEGVIVLREATDRRFDEVIKKFDERVQPIALAARDLATKKPRE